MGINWKNIPGTDGNLQIGVDWHENQNDDNYFISPEIYRWDNYYTDNSGGNYWETLYKNDGTTSEWGPYSWSAGSGTRSIDTFATYTYTRKDSSYDIYLTISWDSSTGTAYNGGFHTVSADSLDFWITIPAKEITKKTITLEYYSDENTLWKTESREISLNTTTNVYFPKVKPTKDGYKFTGWKINNTTYIKDEYFPVTNPDSVISIYAQWAKICTVSFIYNDEDKININKIFSLTAGSTIDLNKEFGVQSKVTKETIEHIYKIKTSLEASSPIGTKTARRITTTSKEFIDWKSEGETEETTNGTYTVTKDVKFTKPIWINPKSSTVNESIILPEIEKETVQGERTVIKTIEEECRLEDAQKKGYSFKIYIKNIEGIVHSVELPSAENNFPTYIKRKIDKNNIKEIYNEIREYTQWKVYKEDDKTKFSILSSGTTYEVKENDSNQTFIIVPDRTISSVISEEIISSTELDNSEFVENTEQLLGIYLTPWGKSTKVEKFNGWLYNGKLIDPKTEGYFEMTKDSETGNSYSLGSSTEPKLTIKSSVVSFQPQILNFTLTRCKEDGSLDDDGIYAKITGTLVQTQPYADNSIKLGVVTPSIKINDEDSEKSGVTFYPLSNNTPPLFDYKEESSQPFGYCLKLPNKGFLVDSQYKVELILSGSDNIWSVSAADYLTQSFFTIDLLAGGTGLAIGAPSSSSGFINNMETSCTQGFAIYPPQKKSDDKNIVVTGGRNLIKQENFKNYAATIEIPETGTYSISSDVAFEVYKTGSSNSLPSDRSADTNSLKWTSSLSKEDSIEIKPIITEEVDKENFQKTLKVEKGPSCSAYTPAPEDGATFFVDKDQINLLNSDIIIRKNNNVVTLDHYEKTALNYKNSVSLNCNAGITLNGDIMLASGILKIEENSKAQIIATSAKIADTAESAKAATSAETANSANKLNISDIGVNNKQPVYFKNGVPVAWTTPIADYIVAQGKCDFWIYRMWASGVAECWGSTSITSENVSSEWGVFYEGSAHSNGFPGNTSDLDSGSPALAFSIKLDDITYTTLFKNDPDFCLCSFKPTGNAGISGIEIGGGLSAMRTPTVYLLRPTSASVEGRYSYYAKGQWK